MGRWSAYAGPSSDDGRLDLDDLDRPADLDVIGAGSPTYADRVRDLLRSTGVTPWMRRHRAAMVALALAVTVVAVAGGAWWIRRPEPLPAAPLALAKATGPDPTSTVEPDPVTGLAVGVTQLLTVMSAERPGVGVVVLGLAGPGLRDADDDRAVALDPARPGLAVLASARLDCSTPEATTLALAARPDDYGVVLRRTDPGGEVRVDRVPLVGSPTLAEVVRSACLQIAAGRDLEIGAISATAVPDVVAVDLDVEISNTSPRQWTGLRVSPAAQPELTNGGPPAELTPGATGHLVARIWPQDCARPAESIEAGLPVRADLGPDGSIPGAAPGSSTFSMRLPESATTAVEQALLAACGTQLPRLTVDSVTSVVTGVGSSAGVLDLAVTVEAPGAAYVEAEQIGALVVGQLSARVFPVPVIQGRAQLDLRWILPPCAVVQRGGRPELKITLAGALRRPYLLPLRGAPLRASMTTLCGDEVAQRLS